MSWCSKLRMNCKWLQPGTSAATVHFPTLDRAVSNLRSTSGQDTARSHSAEFKSPLQVFEFNVILFILL